MKVTYPISSNEGDEYLILINSFEKSIFPDSIIELLNNIEIVDITLERISGKHTTKPDILFEIANFIAGFLFDNENIILYFYCDDMHDIGRRNQSITPQKFRSDLFSTMFSRYALSHNVKHLIHTPLEIKSDRDIYIHLISRDIHLPLVTAIKEILMEMSVK